MYRASSGRLPAVHQALAICLALAAGVLSLSGCASKAIPVALAPLTTATDIVSANLIPAGDMRLVTVRHRPDATTATRDVLCSEPSPDWATAQARQLALTASGGVTGGANGALGVNGSTAETILAMAGRTAGVVALRDGLYAACQAYANGVIGKDGYALVLSQYGNLLVALAGGGAGGGSAGGSGGGGYQRHGAADLPFLWMAGQVAPLLQLDLPGIAMELDLTRPLTHGPRHNSYKGLWHWAGQEHRCPGVGTNEFIHPSALDRTVQPNPKFPRFANLPVWSYNPLEVAYLGPLAQPLPAGSGPYPVLPGQPDGWCERRVACIEGS